MKCDSLIETSLYRVETLLRGERVSLFDLATWKNGLAFRQINFSETGIPVIKIAELSDGLGTTTAYTQQKFSEDVHLVKGDLLFSWSGTPDTSIDIFRFQLEEGWLNQHIFKVTPKEEIVDRDYFYFLMKGLKPYFIRIASNKQTIGLGHVTIADLKGMSVVLPSLETQHKIASVLSSLDDKIELNDRINANLEEQARAIFKSWFVDFEPFGGKMPEDWTTADIYSIAKIVYGAPFSSKLFNTDGIGVPIVRIRDLHEQKFSTFTTEEHPRGHLIRAGDIVVGMDGEFRPYLWGNDPAWLNQRICIFENKRPKGKFFLLSTIRPLLERIEKTQVGTTVIHIGKKDFDAFRIQLPDENTLNKFDELTYPLFEKIIVNLHENARLSSLRDALIPRLLSGELDVSELETT